ncbi:MAG: four helix bundle protein [Paludibacteraceae bacterium]|nr:four helix bundle protein [Paludibacteraceae bacterium]
MRENVLIQKTEAFSIRIVNAERYLRTQKKERVISNQILRSGTSIGANCAESQDAQSPSDFVHKLSIALKEADETKYWLNLLKGSHYISEESYISMMKDLKEILALLTKIIKTTKEKYNV